MITVTFLGTTASIPTRERNLPSVFVMFKGDRILFDCGEGTQRQLMDKNLKFMKIDKIFITHWHADHFAGILGLVQTMSLEGRKKKLLVYGPEGTKKFLEQFLNIGYYYRGFEVEAIELKDADVVRCDGYEIIAFKTLHGIPSLGYSLCEDLRKKADMDKAKALGLETSPIVGELKSGKTIKFKGEVIRPEDIVVEIPGRKVVYTGDTRYSRNVIKYSESADLLIHDATFSSNMEHVDERGHSTSLDAANVAKLAGVKQLILTHISRRYQNEGDDTLLELLKDATSVFKNTLLAYDFLTLEIK
ncbi:MAG: ribonuclease Z [DPANN group archaeon]|nr:ribonuclease Z [DPANN group archaeon]